jgi:hypothetical protein
MVMDKVGPEAAAAVVAGSDYQAALTSGTVLRRRDRRFLGVEGKSPGEMLKGIVSGRIPAPLSEGADGWREGEASYSAILTPKGRMLTDLRMLPDPEGGFLLDLPAAGFGSAIPHFRKYLHPRFAQVTDRSEALGMLTIVGPEGWYFLSKTLGLEVGPQGPESVRHRRGKEASDIWLVGNTEVGLPGIDLVLSLKVIEEVRGRLEEVGVRAMGPDSLRDGHDGGHHPRRGRNPPSGHRLREGLLHWPGGHRPAQRSWPGEKTPSRSPPRRR